jgi:Cdc6-like AAA superfamily ATPase
MPPATWGLADEAAPPASEARIEGGTQLPKFYTTAGDHLEHDRRNALSRQRVRVRNAFTPAQPVADPHMFSGRQGVLTSMIRATEDRHLHLIIYGERGVGKTSLLHMLARAAQEARYIVVYISCGATSNFTETFSAVAAEIPLMYHAEVSPTSSRSEAGSTMADLIGSAEMTPRQFADAAANLRGTRVLVILDEFDRAQLPEFRRDVAELIKSLSDLSARVQLLIGGVAGDLAGLMDYTPSIRRAVAAIPISAMDEKEVRELIANGSRLSGVAFADAATEVVLDGSQGSPYLANLLCHLSAMSALDHKRNEVTTDDVREALDESIADLRARLPGDVINSIDQYISSTTDAGLRSASAESFRRDRLESRLRSDGLLRDASSARMALITDTLSAYLQLAAARARMADPGPALRKAAQR